MMYERDTEPVFRPSVQGIGSFLPVPGTFAFGIQPPYFQEAQAAPGRSPCGEGTATSTLPLQSFA